jgi:rhomboid protease GluP
MAMPFQRLRQTPVTGLLLLAIAAMYLWETLAGGATNPNVLLALGANYPPAVLQQGEWWRLFTSMFLHGGFAHVLLNGWALYQLGALCELALGSTRMLVVYVLAGLAGSAASLLWTQGLSVGASGAIFGLLGAMIAFLLRRRERLTPFARSLLSQLVGWAVINIFFGFTFPMIDNAAHLGGCAAGFVVGFLLRGREAERRPVEATV